MGWLPVGPMFVAQAAQAATTDPLQLLLQYGVLGIFAVLMILYTRGSIAREREKYDQAQLQVDKLNEYIRLELLPKQVETAMLHRQVAEALEQAVNVIQEMKIRESITRQQHHLPMPPPDSGPRRG